MADFAVYAPADALAGEGAPVVACLTDAGRADSSVAASDSAKGSAGPAGGRSPSAAVAPSAALAPGAVLCAKSTTAWAAERMPSISPGAFRSDSRASACSSGLPCASTSEAGSGCLS
eukprot:scaffold29139_cov90-Isochrysis_galbana.AAC.2